MIVTDHQQTRVTVTVYGEFTVEDFREFEELVNYKIRFEGPVDLFLDLRQMAAFTLDMAWEQIRFTRAHGKDFKRIAVLTESQWMAWSAWLNQAFVEAQIRVFEDEAQARDWLSEA